MIERTKEISRSEESFDLEIEERGLIFVSKYSAIKNPYIDEATKVLWSGPHNRGKSTLCRFSKLLKLRWRQKNSGSKSKIEKEEGIIVYFFICRLEFLYVCFLSICHVVYKALYL